MDMAHALDNPLWSSLTTLHRDLALAAGGLVRYPAEVAPFLAMSAAGAVDPAALAALVAPTETAFMLGPRPVLPAGWVLEDLGVISQLLCEAPLTELPGPPVVELTAAERPAILALAALVYPHYFRPRTPELGRYRGVLGDGRLDAMIGERMALPGLREISAVCTHPERLGRGLARRMLAVATNDLLAHGTTAFLHVSPANTRAVAIYERAGYRRRIDVPFFAVRVAP
jgi:GNAT superfamily N-acetyltransferase